jgi:hypothetical protein
MFVTYCPRHQARVLLGTSAIEDLVNTPGGVVVRWRCHCGASGAHVTGRGAGSVAHMGHMAADAA